MSEGRGNETEPVTYEQVLEAFRAVRAAGIRSPEIDKSQVAVDAMALLSKYDNQELIRTEGDEHALRMWAIQRDMLFIEAGLGDLDRDRLDEALSWLHNDYLIAQEDSNVEAMNLAEEKIKYLLEKLGRSDEISDFVGDKWG